MTPFRKGRVVCRVRAGVDRDASGEAWCGRDQPANDAPTRDEPATRAAPPVATATWIVIIIGGTSSRAAVSVRSGTTVRIGPVGAQPIYPGLILTPGLILIGGVGDRDHGAVEWGRVARVRARFRDRRRGALAWPAVERRAAPGDQQRPGTVAHRGSGRDGRLLRQQSRAEIGRA